MKRTPVPYHSIDIREASGVRTLHFGSEWVQGAMRVARPWHLELEYTREMMMPLLLGSRHPQRVLLIGLGAASLTKFLYRHCPNSHQTVIEYNDQVIAAARQFFKLPHDPRRLEIVHDDGVAFMATPTGHYDLILVDGFDAKGRAGALESVEFYQHCQRCLSDTGLLTINLLGRSRGFHGTVERLQQAFANPTLVLPPCPDGNVTAFAALEPFLPPDMIALRQLAMEFKRQTGLNLLPTLSRWEAHLLTPRHQRFRDPVQ